MDDTTTQIRHGIFRKAIPKMPKYLAIICCLLNILLPGCGTLISAFFALCNTTHEYDKNYKAFLVNCLAFSLQLLSSILIFGWLWSIRNGLMFIRLAGMKPHKESSHEKEPDLPFYVRRHSSVDANMMNFMPTKERYSFSLNRVREDDE